MYRTLMTVSRFADWLTTIIMAAARNLSIRASNIADAAEDIAYNARHAANEAAAAAAQRHILVAQRHYTDQCAAIKREQAAIELAHPGR